MIFDTLKKIAVVFLFASSTAFSQLLTFNLSNEAATGCANHMAGGNYAFNEFYWDGSSSSSATFENLISADGTDGLEYSSSTFTLHYYSYINVVNPNGDPLQAGERGDFRIYGGGEITIKDNGDTKLTLTNCITETKVSWPVFLGGPGDDVVGSGWGTIDEANSDPAWVTEFNLNGTGQVYIEYTSITNVIAQSCAGVSRYDFTINIFPSSFNRDIYRALVAATSKKEGGLSELTSTLVDMPEINLSFEFISATFGGSGNDKNDLYAEYRTDDPGGDAPTGINAVGSVGYWDIGTTLDEFDANITFDLSTYPGISNMNDIVMLKRASGDAAWEEYANQSIDGNTIICTNVTEFSQWVPGSKGGDALPVEMISFTGKTQGNVVILNWQTATEMNNYGFEVERQNSEESWKNIGFVEGHGNSNSPKEYTFVDSSPMSGIVKYRLKQIDTDGKFEYSEIVKVEIEEQLPTKFELYQNYPNPFNPSTTIKFTIPSVEDAKFASTTTKLIVYDILGREVATLVNENLKPGNYEVNFDASNLSGGVYFYRINSGNEYKSVKKMMLLK